ncbi:11694_t:CDS:2, partial [Entrophospora sp. SA101]
KTDSPKITAYNKKEEYTKISFNPDLEKFGMTEFTDDTVALLNKRVYDTAGVVKDVKVFLNDKRIQVKNFKEYVQMYLKSVNADAASSKISVVHEKFGERWEVVIAPSVEGQFQQVSFVNSICTSKGGLHVKHVTEQITTKLAEHIEKKNKDLKVKPQQVRNHIWIFVNCLIENPTFDSQTKEYMTLKQSSFGSKCTINDDFIKKTIKIGIIESIVNDLKSKQVQVLKKTDGAKKNTVNVEKLDDAVNAGTKNACNCTLVLTEGDSAKALALAGFDVVGHNNWGVYPLRGKLLNVRDASVKQVAENKEIQALKRILGLQHDKKYDSLKDLRYGKLMIMTDQDLDGSHIKGLIINFFDHFYPSLLKQPGFLQEFITPIVKCSKNKTSIPFYTLRELEEWKNSNDNGKGWTIKYYKGLGTSTSEEAREYFNDLGKHVKKFKPMDDEDHKLIDMAFAKKNADERKSWIRGIEDGTYIDYRDSEITIKDFINKELSLFSLSDNIRSIPSVIDGLKPGQWRSLKRMPMNELSLFSLSDNIRSIPSVIDGLKPGQRKVLFSCITKNLIKDQSKVSSLAGYVSENSAYHHGEASLHSTIISLAQDFVGSNNINLLEPIGQFGKRNDGGKSAASAQGIGTGWSTNIPNFNPKDIIHNLRRKIKGEEMIPMHPWYRGFYGEIKQTEHNKYTSYGIISKKDDTHVVISELPIRKWTEDYKSKTLNDFRENNTIRNISRNNCTNERVDLEIELTVEQMEKAEKEGLEKTFQLTTALATSNMMCFDPNNKLAKYDSPEDIIKEFYHERSKLYVKRKNHLIKDLQKQISIMEGKVRFIYMKLDSTLKFEGLKKAEIVKLLESHKFEKIYDAQSEENSSEGTETNRNTKGYDYLMKLTCWGFSREEVDKYENKKKSLYSELKIISEMSTQDLWLKDLDELEAAWDEFADNGKSKSKQTKVDRFFTNSNKLNSIDIDDHDDNYTEEKIENIMDDVDSSGKDYTERKTTIKKANKGKSKLKAEDDEFKLNHTTATSGKSKVIETIDDDDTDYIEPHETKTTTKKPNNGRSKLKVEDDEFKLNHITATSSRRKIIEMADDDDDDYIEPHETEITTKKANNGRSKLKVEDDEFKLNHITATSSKRKIIEMVDDDDDDYIEPHETEITTKKRKLRT